MAIEGRPLVYGDAEVTCLDAGLAVAAVRGALAAHGEGRLHAPPRSRLALGRGELVLTLGALAGAGYGFRAYDTVADRDQLVVVWDEQGALSVLVWGEELGALRTGTIGAVAIDLMTPPEVLSVGVIGAGRQAWAQLWALRAVRRPRDVLVYSRNGNRLRTFVERAEAELELPIRAATTPRAAVVDRDIVITATSSSVPVLDAAWLAPGTHVNAVGPKRLGHAELPDEVAGAAGLIVTDSLAQARAYPGGLAMDVACMVELGAVLTRGMPAREDPALITMFCSVGLAGTEVALAAALPGALRLHQPP